jgi:hypothetical protein
MATQSQNNFDFDAYNKVLTNAGPGLKLFLAEQLLTQVQSSMVYFNNPLANDINDVVAEVKHVRSEGRKQAEKRANAGNTAEIDDATVDGGAMTKPSNSADAGKVDATK